MDSTVGSIVGRIRCPFFCSWRGAEARRLPTAVWTWGAAAQRLCARNNPSMFTRVKRGLMRARGWRVAAPWVRSAVGGSCVSVPFWGRRGGHRILSAMDPILESVVLTDKIAQHAALYFPSFWWNITIEARNGTSNGSVDLHGNPGSDPGFRKQDNHTPYTLKKYPRLLLGQSAASKGSQKNNPGHGHLDCSMTWGQLGFNSGQYLGWIARSADPGSFFGTLWHWGPNRVDPEITWVTSWCKRGISLLKGTHLLSLLVIILVCWFSQCPIEVVSYYYYVSF